MLKLQNIKLGGVAQLGARLNGIQKVVGSIPIVSTTTNKSEPCAGWRWVRIYCLSIIVCF